jgi:7-cyano-7-deazaguanine synthase
MKGKKIGVLYSGGVDSCALIGQLLKQGNEITPVYIQCGLPWEKAEKWWAKKFLKALGSRKIKPLLTVRLLLEGAYSRNWSLTGRTPNARSTDDKVFLPARNLLLIIKALLALSSKNVWRLALATLKGNPFPDATPEFFVAFEKLLKQSFRHGIKIDVPFRNSTKTIILRKNRDLPLQLSFSCINPINNRHCGHCNKCAERKKAFRTAGIVDKTAYQNQRKSNQQGPDHKS